MVTNQTISPEDSFADSINILLNNPPAGLYFSTDEMEEIACGENLRDHLETIDEGVYLDDFLSSLGWWLKVAQALEAAWDYARKSHADSGYRDIDSRLEVIMRLYLNSRKGRCLVDVVGSDSTGLELVRRYWELREYIIGLVRRDVPDVDLGAAAPF